MIHRSRLSVRLASHPHLVGLVLGLAMGSNPTLAQTSGWRARSVPTAANLWSVAEAPMTENGVPGRTLVAVGEQGTILTSVDRGATWSIQHSGTSAWLTAIAYLEVAGARRFVAVGDGGTVLMSPDGRTWSRETSPTTLRLNAISRGEGSGTLYAFGEAGVGWLVRDRDGSWTRRDAPFVDRWMRGGANPLVGQDGAVFETQSDPTSGQAQWRPLTTPVDADLEAIALGPPSALRESPTLSFVAVGANGTILQRTLEGDWVQRSSGTTERLRGLVAKDGGTVTLLTNTLRIALGEFFAVGTNGVVLRSADGVHWQREPVPTSRNLNGITATNDALVIVGDAGTILTLDGVPSPTIARQPVVHADSDGRPVVTATATGDGALSYLWVQLVPAGAPRFVVGGEPQLSLPARPPLDVPSPTYQLIVGNAFGITRSDPVTLHRFVNLSTLAFAGTGDATLIGGFSVSPSLQGDNGRFLVRAVGPGLREFGVGNALVTPRVSVYAGERLLATNEAWHRAGNAVEIRQAAGQCGAFALAEDSDDAALLLSLGSGNYSVRVEESGGRTGMVLLEIYDASATPLPRLANLAVRGPAGGGQGNIIGGFVVAGATPKRVLLRAAGPALRAFGLENVLPRPRVMLRRGMQDVVSGAAWNDAPNAAAIRLAASVVQAFPFPEGSADAALLVDLEPGAYTVELGEVADGNGVALLEIYERSAAPTPADQPN